MTNIAILDDFEMTDVQRKHLESLGNLQIFTGLPVSDDEIIDRAQDAEILIIGWTKISHSIMEKLPKLKYIAVWATGYDYIDLQAATNQRVLVSNIPRYATESVAEITMAYILMLSRQILLSIDNIKNGNIDRQKTKGQELSNKTLGIVGTGSIGGQVTQLAKCFNMRVVAATKHPTQERAKLLNIEYTNLNSLFEQSDYISLHLPLTSETHKIIGETQLQRMQPHSFLVNTARSGLIDHEALYTVLTKRKIAGAALDDIENSYLKQFIRLSNVILTPHIGFATHEAVKRKTDICISNIQSYINRNPQNIVNPFG